MTPAVAVVWAAVAVSASLPAAVVVAGSGAAAHPALLVEMAVTVSMWAAAARLLPAAPVVLAFGEATVAWAA
jgi:hypothetical protein